MLFIRKYIFDGIFKAHSILLSIIWIGAKLHLLVVCLY